MNRESALATLESVKADADKAMKSKVTAALVLPSIMDRLTGLLLYIITELPEGPAPKEGDRG